MSETLKTYRTTAMLLWATVAVVAGLVAGSFFGLKARQQIFPVVLMVGAYGLLLVRMYGRFGPELEADSGDDSEGETAADLLQRDESLSPDKAREWLDDFLVGQQR